MFGKARDIVALDLGTHSVKMMKLGRGKKAWQMFTSRGFRHRIVQHSQESPARLVNVGIARLPAGSVVEGQIEKPQVIVETIRNLAEHIGIDAKNQPLALALSGYEVMIKRVTLPIMTEEQLDERMADELGEYVPYPISEVNIDYEILGMAKDKSSHMDVMLVAAKREVVNEYVRIIQDSGFEPALIDVDFFALSNAFELTYGVYPDTSFALIDMGASKTSLAIINQGVLTFTQTLPMGGDQVNERIRAELADVDIDPEVIKLGGARERVDDHRLASIVAEVAKSWSGNIHRAVDLYYKNYTDDPLNKIYLCGGVARMPGLAGYMRRELQVPIEIFNPLSDVIFDRKEFNPDYLDDIGPEMAVCMGLGLREATKK